MLAFVQMISLQFWILYYMIIFEDILNNYLQEMKQNNYFQRKVVEQFHVVFIIEDLQIFLNLRFNQFKL